jgi:O-antigen/teichoic acid export membrane protein
LSASKRSYGSGARILSVGIAATGLFTFAYFSIASHVLDPVDAKRLDLLWSVMFVVISVIYRPIEQLLSRTIAERRAQGHREHPLRIPITIQASFALIFLVVALALHGELVNHVFNGYSALYDVLVFGTLAYAGSYFARGWLAGHEYFALYGGLVLMESTSRICFALAVAIGIASGQTAVALGIAAAPLLSLVVVPLAFARRGGERREGSSPGDPRAVTANAADTVLARPTAPDDAALAANAAIAAPFTAAEVDAALAGPGTEGVQEAAAGRASIGGGLSLKRGGRFALWVSGIMLSEQTLLNAAVLTVDATSSKAALAGIVFNVMLIARAPLQLFQAIQTSLLPHLTGLEAQEGHAAFARAIRITVLAIAAFAAAVTLGLLALGPFVMGHVVFGQHYAYKRFGLALIGIGMGMHLAAGALNQAALARNRARAAATCWLIAAIAFLGWMFVPAVGEQVLRAELGYCGAASLLALLLALLYRGAPTTSPGASRTRIARLS